MPHILFLTEKWCDTNPDCGPTNSEHNLFGSLLASRVATFEGIHFDEYWRRYGRNADEAILARVQTSPRPDLVVATPIWCSSITASRDTYAAIQRMGIPIVLIAFDASNPDVRREMLDYAEVATSTVVLDLAEDELFLDPRFVPMWTPQDPRIFQDRGLERAIDVSFVGSVDQYPDRKRAIDRLRQAGIEVHHAGGQREGHLSVHDYAALFQRSRISLNFAKSVLEGPTQVKGRVFEATMCGSLLLEEDNPHVRKWLTPGVDYVPFTDPDDLAAKVEYHLKNEKERARIARSGQRKAEKLYHARNFWKRILELAGLPQPVRSLSGMWKKLTSQPVGRLPTRMWQKVHEVGVRAFG